uniref:ADP ribosylation factor like GTPase 5B n=1 Tax=Falco tinnunculus TaxID=100819 RepID=A0A8C4URM9_FALTI
MGLIFAKLWSLFGSQEHKVIIVGLDNAGKTTILYQFLMNEVVHTSPTIGSNVEEIVVKNTHFLMWDIGGQESLRSSWNTYYSNTEKSIATSKTNAHEGEETSASIICSSFLLLTALIESDFLLQKKNFIECWLMRICGRLQFSSLQTSRT